jgi:hypothetical protein
MGRLPDAQCWDGVTLDAKIDSFRSIPHNGCQVSEMAISGRAGKVAQA